MSLLTPTDEEYDSLHDSEVEEEKKSRTLPRNISRRKRRVMKYHQKQLAMLCSWNLLHRFQHVGPGGRPRGGICF